MANKYDIYIHPYNINSKSACDIKDEFNRRGIKCAFTKKEGSKVRDGFILNWGCSTMDPALVRSNEVVNNHNLVAIALDKALFAERNRENGYVPQSYFNKEKAYADYCRGNDLVLRTTTVGKRGEGTFFLKYQGGTPLNVEEAWDKKHEEIGVPVVMYTRYKKKDKEYRVYVMNGTAFLAQEKRRKLDTNKEDVDWQIRKPDHFAFCKFDLSKLPNAVKAAVDETYHWLRLDFMGLDIGYSEYNGQAWVFEANTAPGMEGSDIDKFVDQFVKEYRA